MKFIKEVLKHKCLSNSNHPDYKNTMKKDKAWECVAQAMTDDWPNMTLSQRISKVKYWERKWKSIVKTGGDECKPKKSKALPTIAVSNCTPKIESPRVEEDPDKTLLKTLVPTFKLLDENHKHDALFDFYNYIKLYLNVYDLEKINSVRNEIR